MSMLRRCCPGAPQCLAATSAGFLRTTPTPTPLASGHSPRRLTTPSPSAAAVTIRAPVIATRRCCAGPHAGLLRPRRSSCGGAVAALCTPTRLHSSGNSGENSNNEENEKGKKKDDASTTTKSHANDAAEKLSPAATEAASPPEAEKPSGASETGDSSSDNNASDAQVKSDEAKSEAKPTSPPKGSDTEARNTSEGGDKREAVPRGFEGFYTRMINSRITPRSARNPESNVHKAFTVTPEEQVVLAEMAHINQHNRTRRRLWIAIGLLTSVVALRFFLEWRQGLLQDPDSAQRDYKAVIVDIPAHTALFISEAGKVLLKSNFIDYYTFERGCDPDKDIIIQYPTYYPYLPMLLLCLLPLLAAVNAGYSTMAQSAFARTAAERSRFRFQRELDVRTRLRDVAGLTEAKGEVTEVIDFLKQPQRYASLGAKLPKGVLLDGPPGVGKTLLAKAIAGEAMVPFVSCSGSEFEEEYVGVGAQRVRELFREAHKSKPCVVFIDEIDAFGRKRSTDGGGSSRGTLNAFLSELDGFKDASGIMVLAATNRADILDPALTRSGRFDRKITLEKPPHKDRVAIAEVHLRPLRLEPVTDMKGYAETLAALTPGCSGADIFNVCNEAAIQAAREDSPHVCLRHFHKAVERVLVGLEKSAVRYTPTERERLAYHEAGTVILSWFQRDTDPVIKTTILPRGQHRTGVTQKLPQNVYISTQDRLTQNVVAKLGGYVSEEYFFDDVSSGAADDLQSATAAARQMVCVYGMAPGTIGHFGYEIDRDNAITKPFGPRKENAIDAAVEEIVQSCLEKARALLRQHLTQTRIIAGTLLKQETIDAHELWLLLGDRPVMTQEFLAYLES